MNKKIRLIAIIIVIPMICMLTSCVSNSNEEETWERMNNRYGYDVIDCNIGNEKTYITNIINVMHEDDVYYICTNYHDDNNDNEFSELINTIIVVDSDGTVEKEYQLEDNSLPQSVVDGAFVRTEDGILYKYDMSNGELICIDDSLEPNSLLVYPSTTGYLVFYSDRIIKYTSNDQVIGCVEFGDELYPNYTCPYYEEDGNEYVVFQDAFYDYYYQIDFNNNSIEYKLSTKDISNRLSSSSGKYIVDGTAEYKVNIENSYIEILADFDYINLKPESSGHQSTSFFSFDDNHFAVGYSYYGGSIELQLFEYNNTIDYSDTEIIEIGGFDISYDLPLKWAIYKFNTSQNQYRVVTTDYFDMFNWTDGNEAQSVTLELISYFNNGNAPDIFYGSFFDYRSLFESGLVIDMMPYYQTDSSFEDGVLIDSIQNLMIDDGICYNVFAGFYLNGFWAKEEFFPSNDVSIYEIEMVSEENGILPMGGEYSHNIADYVLRYYIAQRVGNSNQHIYTIDELINTINYSIEYGIASSSIPNEIPGFSLVEADQYLSCLSFVNDIYDLQYSLNEVNSNMCYIGYPSIEGSMRLVNPVGLVSISSSAENPEVCWELISMLYDEDVQRIIATNQNIPVLTSVLDEYIDATLHPETVPIDSVFYSYVHRQKPVNQVTIDLFVDSINSVNALLSYDWGVYNIICEEIDSYDIQNRPIDIIAETLQSRIDLYVLENY